MQAENDMVEIIQLYQEQWAYLFDIASIPKSLINITIGQVVSEDVKDIILLSFHCRKDPIVQRRQILSGNRLRPVRCIIPKSKRKAQDFI